MNNKHDSLKDLLDSYTNSPEPSFKVSNYFQIYTSLFSHLRNEHCTFIETGILNGGSLFMWKKWLGKNARIIGIDLNPEAKKWENHGFEIYIGDQGDPVFWKSTFEKIGKFDALLDDGGHQSFQQIVTLTEAVIAAKEKCIIAIEDTCTSFMKEFSKHQNNTFLEFAKDATDCLLAKTSHFSEGEFPKVTNSKSVGLFENIYSVEFFSGIVAFKVDPLSIKEPQLVWNQTPKKNQPDFRYFGKSSALVDWPNLFEIKSVLVEGGKK